MDFILLIAYNENPHLNQYILAVMDPNAYEKKMAEEAKRQYSLLYPDKSKSKDRPF